MKQLLRSTTAYRKICAERKSGSLPQTLLALFPDEKYLRELLRECARAYFGGEGTREGDLAYAESHSDCLFFPAEGGKLTVSDGATIIEESMLRPVEGGIKLFVLDAFHLSAPLVQNKLLKILEEPPKGVYFLLGGSADFSILPTVLSRAVKVVEPPFAEEAILSALHRRYGASEENMRAAAACGGILSAAETLKQGGGEDFALAEEFLTLKRCEELARKIGERKEKTAFLAALRLTLKDMLFYRTGQEKYVALKSDRLRALAEQYRVGTLVKGLELLSTAEKQVKFNANYGQCLLSLAIGIAEEEKKWQKLS